MVENTVPDATVPDTNVPDTIERSITIEAPVEAVWELVSTPGWWINSGTIDLSLVESVGEDRAVVHHPEYGDFEVERFDVDPPRRVSFRWLVSGVEGRDIAGPEDQLLHTVVTFTLEADGMLSRLSLVEKGFASQGVDEPARRRAYDGNSEGWDVEMGAAKAHVEGR